MFGVFGKGSLFTEANKLILEIDRIDIDLTSAATRQESLEYLNSILLPEEIEDRQIIVEGLVAVSTEIANLSKVRTRLVDEYASTQRTVGVCVND